MKGLTIVFTGKEQLELREVEVADPGPGRLLVETVASLISTGTECICYQRNFDPGTGWDKWVKYPFYPGYSAVGRVIKVGAGVKEFQEGQMVLAPVNHAQYVTCSEPHAVPVPAGVSAEEATWGKLAYITQHGFRRSKLALGEVAVVIGAGLLGQLVVQYCSLAGAAEVIVIDTAEGRLKFAAKHGATKTICRPVGEAAEEVRQASDGKMAEVVFDMTGHWSVFPHALGLLKRFGRMVLIGDTGQPEKQHMVHDVLNKDLTIMGAHDNNSPMVEDDHLPWSRKNMVKLFYRYLVQGRMRVKDMITHRFDPREAKEAYGLLTQRRSEAMAVVFDWTKLAGKAAAQAGERA